MKLVELNLFFWILYCSWDHYIGDEDKRIEKNVLPKLDCFSDPATIGPRWTRWLTSFELYADRKGFIINEGTTAAAKRRRRAMLLHLAGPDVQKIFTTLTDTGDATYYASAVEFLNAYFVPQVN